jgi:hypothetical protein
MSNPFVPIANNIRQWFLEDRPTATSYAFAMTNPQVLVPFLEKVYARLFRNRRHFLEIGDAGWKRDEPFYGWLRGYFDTTDPQHPDKSGALSFIPRPIQSIDEGVQHLTNKFDEEFAAQDTMLIREKERIETYLAMNGEDNDCHWSYTGTGGGQYLHSINTKSVGYDGITHDNLAQQLWHHRKHNQNPTAMYGALFLKQDAIGHQLMGTPDMGRAAQGDWLGF